MRGAEESREGERVQAEHGRHTYTYDQRLAPLEKPACAQSQTDTTGLESGTTKSLDAVIGNVRTCEEGRNSATHGKGRVRTGALYGEEGRICLGCCLSVLGEEQRLVSSLEDQQEVAIYGHSASMCR